MPDLVGEISCIVKREWPSWGSRRIAGILARMGLKASRTSVQRALRPSRRKRTIQRALLRVRFLGGDRRLPLFALRPAA